MATTPKPRDNACAVSICMTTRLISSRKCSDCAAGIPNSVGSCDKPMISAAALMKPIRTGFDRKLSRMPMRNTPKAIWNIPEINASRMA